MVAQTGESTETYAFPASFGQERLWFVHQLDSDLPLYNVSAPVLLPFALTLDQIEAAIALLARRHEALRTALTTQDGGRLTQIVHADIQIPLAQTDLSGLSPEERRRRAGELFAADIRIPFRLEEAPLWRVRAISGSGERWICHFVVHHAIFDGRSTIVLMTELNEICRAIVERREPDLPDLPIQYGDYAAWQRARVEDGSAAGQLAYWAERLADLPAPLDLPADLPRPARKSYRGDEVLFHASRGLGPALVAAAGAEQATPFIVAVAAYATLLFRLSGQPDLLIGSPVDRRELPELVNVIGMLVNTVVFRVDCSGEPTFRELVRRTRGIVLDALDNGDVPFDRLVELHAGDRDPGRSPLYQAGFNLLPLSEVPQPAHGTAKFDILLDLALSADDVVTGRVEYSTDLFTKATAGTFAARFQRLLAAALATPDTPIGALPILDPAERERLLTAGQPAASRPAPGGLLTDRFAATVAAHADRIAVRDATGAQLTYAELDARANLLAHRLRELGVRADALVALCCASDVDLVVAALGVLKAGGGYLPLDPEYPPDRLAFFLHDSAATAVVAHRRFAGRLPACGPPVVAIDELPPDHPAGHPHLTPPPPAASPSSLAYALFTSGSTGRPKAVAVEHRQVLAYLDGLADVVTFAPGQTHAMLQPLTFDFCVTMFYGALLSGGTLHLAPRDLAADAGFVAQLVRETPIDHLKVTPSHLGALQAAVGDPAELLPRRTLMLGGEASRWSWFAGLRRPGVAVVNHYGPTETSVGALVLPGDRAAARPTATTPIGWPLAHVTAYILDERGEPVPDGVTGELYIGGAQVTRGYLGRPALTAERFLPDPFSGRAGARLYRTGDRVRRLPDGATEFLGRVDDQVKVRGYRIELGEVRLALASHPAVTDCAVVVHGEAAQLVGYLVPDHRVPLDVAAVRAHVAARLPEFMVPAILVPVDELPLTPHGKLDRSRLPDPTQDKESTEDGGADAPRTATEEAVAALVSRLLDRGRVGRDDSFFALGGHSLLATQLVTRLRATFGAPLALRTVFEAPTVAAIAAAVDQAARGGARRLPTIRTVPADPPPLASYGQARLWFLDQLERVPQLYNTNLRLRLDGPLDTAALRGALSEIVCRHEVLRTRLVRDGASVVQVLAGPDLPYAELEMPTEDELEAALNRHANIGFDLTAEPPLRVLLVRLVRLAPRRHELLITIHHAATDAWSAGVLVRELRALYAGQSLPPLPVQYRDFAVWQRRLVESRLRATQLAYWRQQLDGVPPLLALATDHPRPARRTYDGAHVPFALPPGVADRLRAVGAAHDATLFMVLLTAFYALLTRYTGQDDLVVGTPAANRSRPELEPLIGFFLNTLVLRTDCAGDPTFVELLRRVRKTTLDAYANSDVPFEALVEELQPTRDLGNTPLVQVLFTMEDTEREAGETGAAGRLALTWQPMGTAVSRFDISLFLWRSAGDLTGAVEYRTDLFDDGTMRRFAEHFTALVSAIAEDADRPLSRVSLLSGEDTARIASWQGDTRPYQVEFPVPCRPSSVITGADGTELSGVDFADRTARLAAALAGRGVGADSVVGVCLPRGVDQLAAVHAVLAAGGAYLPLEPEFPDSRLRGMAADAGARIVVTDKAHAARWSDVSGLGVVTIGEERHQAPTLALPVPPDALAYVMFTSGSTGRPKGVGVSRRAIANRLAWMQEAFPLGPSDRILVKTPFSFDVSVWELLWPLSAGASVVVAGPGGHRDPEHLADLVARHGVTTVHFVPSMLAAFLSRPELAARVAGLRRVICSGEALSPDLVDRFFRLLPGVELHNLYGPTEAAVDVSWHECRPGEAVVPIGHPVPNTRLEVVDAAGDPVPVGLPGELCIGGVQVARGYLGQAALTAERFVPDPSVHGGRRYRTGDLARWLPSGEIEFLGRLDDQVKIRGQRIEPGEISAALAAQPEACAAGVLAVPSDGGDKRLVGYVVADPERFAAVDWRGRLRERLPEFMLPAVFVRLDELPLTANGKLDRAALPLPTAADIAAAAAPYVAPAGDAERAVARAYADVLEVDEDAVGAQDSFFALGGDSLRSLRLVARIRELGYEVALADVFVHQTVRELAATATATTPEPSQPPPGAAFDMVDAADLARLAQRFGAAADPAPGAGRRIGQGGEDG